MVVSVGIDVSKDKHDCFIVSSEGEVLADVFGIRPHAAWIGQCRRIKAVGTGVLWPDYNCPQHGRLREFFRWPKARAKSMGHRWDAHSFLELCPTLPAGTSHQELWNRKQRYGFRPDNQVVAFLVIDDVSPGY